MPELTILYTYCCTACHAGWQTEHEDEKICRWCGSDDHVVLRGMYGRGDLK